MSLSIRDLPIFCVAALLVALLSGCEEPPSPLPIGKKIEEDLTQAELDVLKRILGKLPQPLWADWQNCFIPPPDWPATRTLPIYELVEEEVRRLNDRWDTELLAKHFERQRATMVILRKERVSPLQFSTLLLSTGLAATRAHIPATFNFEAYQRRGKFYVDEVTADVRPYQSLTEDQREQLLTRAIWLTRMDRVERVLLPTAATVDLVRADAKDLYPLLPEEFLRDPLAELADPLEEIGVPFFETPGSVTDEVIRWNRSEALPAAATRASEVLPPAAAPQSAH